MEMAQKRKNTLKPRFGIYSDHLRLRQHRKGEGGDVRWGAPPFPGAPCKIEPLLVKYIFSTSNFSEDTAQTTIRLLLDAVTIYLFKTGANSVVVYMCVCVCFQSVRGWVVVDKFHH